MDRRSIVFAIAAFAALFAVNYYFNWEYEEKLRLWHAEQKVKKEKKLVELKSEIETKTVQADQLPLAFIYADEAAKEFLSAAVINEDSLLAFSWDNAAPKKIYARPSKSQEPLKTYELAYQAEHPGELLIYQAAEAKKMAIGDLPDIGSYDLQVVELFAGNAQMPFLIQLAKYEDGTLTLDQDKINTLQKELQPDSNIVPKPSSHGIVLMKEKGRYVPVALYHPEGSVILYLEDLTGLDPLVTKTSPAGLPIALPASSQEYYVLENDYQQLVFSNVGGALTEINLPFKSDSNKASVVLPIEFDRDIDKDHPYNAHFPSHPYFTFQKSASGEYTQHNVGQIGGYYPLLRRDLLETGKYKSVRLNPRYYSMNLLSEYPEVSELVYAVTQFDRHSIVFKAQQQHRTITKTYSLPKDIDAPYCFDLTIEVEGDKRGLWLSTGVPEVELFSDSPAPALKYRLTRQQKSYVESLDLPKDSITNSSVYPDWICNSNGFFGIILDPLNEIDAGFRAAYVPGQSVPTRLVEIDQAYERFKAENFPGYLFMMPLKASGNTMKFRVFAGPFSDKVLNQVDSTYSDENTGYNPDYIASQSYHGWFSFISEPFAKFLFILMKFFYNISGSWAISIILLTVALRIMMYPLNAWSARSMLNMQQISPDIAALQEKHKKDPKKLQQEVMALYRERRVNPVSGCFPMLIQIPFLIGMFDLLKTTFELRGASFIPGWIDNLTAPDVLFSWDTPIFFIGTQFHLLPILLGVVMFLQQRLFSSLPSDPSKLTEQQRQQKTMGSMMSVVFAVMFYNFPSGLNIYWLSSMLLGILQQWWTQRQMPKVTPAPQKPMDKIPPKNR